MFLHLQRIEWVLLRHIDLYKVGDTIGVRESHNDICIKFVLFSVLLGFDSVVFSSCGHLKAIINQKYYENANWLIKYINKKVHLPYSFIYLLVPTLPSLLLFRNLTDLESNWRFLNKSVNNVWKWMRYSLLVLSKSTQISTR